MSSWVAFITPGTNTGTTASTSSSITGLLEFLQWDSTGLIPMLSESRTTFEPEYMPCTEVRKKIYAQHMKTVTARHSNNKTYVTSTLSPGLRHW